MRKFCAKNKTAKVAAAAVAAVFTVPFLSGCPKKPIAPGSADYQAIVQAFTTGTIAFQVGDDARADKELTRASTLAPDEPAVWANLGLFRMRQGNLAEAATALQKARELAPASSPVALLSGILQSRQGKFDEAIKAFEQAAQSDGRNLYARYALAQTIQRQGGATADRDFERQMNGILDVQPTNVAALLESARLSARNGDAATLKKRLAAVAARAASWPPEVKAQLKAAQKAANGPNPKSAAIDVVKLKNVLSRVPDYRADAAAVELSDRDIAPPIERFLKLPSPPDSPAPPDTGLTLAATPLSANDGASYKALAVRAVPLDEKGATALFATDGKTVKRVDAAATTPADQAAYPFPSGNGQPSPDALLPVDVNSDYLTDVALAGPGGFRLLKQAANHTFSDVTAQTTLPAAVTKKAFTGAWTADMDADGDLDIILGSATGTPNVLQNNGDGTFTPITPFPTLKTGLRGWAWADVRGDGVADAALVDGANKLHVFQNERSGQFRERAVPAQIGKLNAVAVADANRNGLLDFVVWDAMGNVSALCDAGDEQNTWKVAPLFQAPAILATPAAPAPEPNPRLLAVDMDANGGTDIVLSANGQSEIWLSDGKGDYAPLPKPITFAALDTALPDATKGTLALIGINDEGAATLAPVQGTKNYHVQILRPRAADKAGDQRINSFGVGGEVELRAGLLYQKLPITGPVVRFGMGTQTVADYARILWPNGSVQGEFALKADETVPVLQRLKGSCPFLFAWNGTEMAFVTDCIWRSPLGLRINAQNTAGVAMTEDRVKLRADQMQPKNGFYDLSVTAELWETHYFDHLSLMAVDHPQNTEIFVDERFAIPPPPLAVEAFAPPHAVASARDDKGADVTELVRKRDGSHVDTFGRGRYQGVTRDHYLEVDLGPNVPTGKPIYLIANGWIHPTDSSINVAIAQGKNGVPSGLTLEVENAPGKWRVAKPALGFPSGKVKTVLIRLDDVLPSGSQQTHRIRLRTNLEIFWDQIQWAERLPNTPLRLQKIAASTADLYYRGFPVVKAKDASSPELPVSFAQTEGTAPIWRDLIGYYTRFGDVRELVKGVDDRFVIMNAGDALRLQYPVLPPPAKGWKRDFVMVSDGWEKDGDYNTGFSKTVLPLPSHANTAYSTPPTRLEDDPVYKRTPNDWQTYHTRYVTPRRFIGALLPAKQGSR